MNICLEGDMCYNVCIFCTIKSLTLLFSTPITIISADTLCNLCSLLSIFQRSAPFLPLANPGGLQGMILLAETKCAIFLNPTSK